MRVLSAVVVTAVTIVALGFAVFVGAWAVTGGRWLIVKTPSMGAAGPVGTLLWVQPTSLASVHVGEVIAFHPPFSTSETYSHRVVAINANGTLTTKGDINGSTDPWQVHRSQLVGRVAMRWWGIGWLVRAVPILVTGGLLLAVVVRFLLAPRWRPPAVIAGCGLILAVATYLLKPLVRAVLISFAKAPGGARATFVGTGLLPLRMSGQGAGHVEMGDGHVASLLVTRHDKAGHFAVHLGVHLSPWWWVVVVLACFSPALWCLIVGLPPADTA
jgi:hypothetical protein